MRRRGNPDEPSSRAFVGPLRSDGKQSLRDFTGTIRQLADGRIDIKGRGKAA